MSVKSKITVLAGAGIMSLLAGGATMADSLKISYADLNVDSHAGAEALYQRIVAAASQLCPQYVLDSRGNELSDYAGAKACRQAAIADAVKSVRSPAFAAVLAGHTGHAPTDLTASR